LRKENKKNCGIIKEQEFLILQMSNTVEAVGAEYLRHDEEKDIYK
jgi:hypothetical protein